MKIINPNCGSFISSYNWPYGKVDTRLGYITEELITEIKTKAKNKLAEANNALLSYISVGGLETDSKYKELKNLIIYSDDKYIDSEIDMYKLNSWTLEIEGKITELNSEIVIYSFTTDLPSPPAEVSEITLSASSIRGTGTLQTMFTVYDGTKWTVIKDYSTVNSAVWKPIKSGTYQIDVYVKDETGKVVTKSMTNVINVPLTISEFTVNVLSPQTLGTGITLTATVSGGTGILQTKFTISDGSTSKIIKDYSEEGRTVWTPTKAGTYKIYVNVKDETGKVVTKSLDYVINPKVTINSFTTNVLSPQTLGTGITLTVTASGGTGKLQTKFFIKDELTSKIIKDYSEEGSTVWTPTKVGTYKVCATVKDETGKGVTKSFDYVINPIKSSCEVNGVVWNYEVNDTANPVNAFNVYPSDKTLKSVKIPSTLDGKKVISIKESAFLNCSSLSSVIIPEGVTSIGKETFKDCTSLERISIPSSVANIDSTAFENCVKLTTIYTDSGSYASSYYWVNGAVDTNIGYTKGSLIIELGDYDTNSDGTVNIIDLANVAKNYNINKSDTNWQEKYDYNYDGIIDLYDLVKISRKIN